MKNIYIILLISLIFTGCKKTEIDPPAEPRQNGFVAGTYLNYKYASSTSPQYTIVVQALDSSQKIRINVSGLENFSVTASVGNIDSQSQYPFLIRKEVQKNGNEISTIGQTTGYFNSNTNLDKHMSLFFQAYKDSAGVRKTITISGQRNN